jgi:hypothetical protein
MRLVLTLLAAPLLMAQGFAPSGLPRAQCGFGDGLSQLREAERGAARPVSNLSEGRLQAEGVVAALEAATATFRNCACPRLAEATQDAATLAASAPSEASAQRVQTVLGQALTRIRMARQVSESRGCA